MLLATHDPRCGEPSRSARAQRGGCLAADPELRHGRALVGRYPARDVPYDLVRLLQREVYFVEAVQHALHLLRLPIQRRRRLGCDLADVATSPGTVLEGTSVMHAGHSISAAVSSGIQSLFSRHARALQT